MATTNYVAELIRRDKKRRKLRSAVGEAAIRYIVGALCALSGGWTFMLAVGIARSEWLPSLPTIGYWWAVLLVWLLRGVFSAIPPTKKSEG